MFRRIRAKIYRTEAEHAKARYDAQADQYAESDGNICNLPSRRIDELTRTHHFQHVLELGCGTGRYFPFVHGQGTYVGVDVSTRMLEIARQRQHLLSDNGISKTELVESDILQFKPAIVFDFVFSIGTIGYHIPFNSEVAGLIKEMLSPGGYFLLQSVQNSRLQSAKNSVKRLLVALGIGDWPILSGYSISRAGIESIAGRRGLTLVRLEEEPDRWNGLPMLLTLFRK